MGAVGIAAFLVGGILLLQANPGGWCLLALSVPLVAACGIGVLDRNPRLIVSDEDLYVRSLGANTISWSQIQTAKEKRIPRSGSVIVLTLYDGTNRHFDVTWLEQKPHVILLEINTRIENAKRAMLNRDAHEP
jgi:hypothetical protein